MYYNITVDWDPKVIGVKNGIYQVELDKNAYDKKTLQKIERLFKSIEVSTNQISSEVHFKFYFKKLKSAKKTSIMSFTPFLNNCHFLINDDTFAIFKKFNLPSFENFHAVVYDSVNDNLDKSYCLFYSVLQDWDVIDFEKTIFTSGGFGNNPKIEHSFKDENDLRNFNEITRVKLLALSKKFDSSLDFFHTRLGGLFVSDKLKVELERNNLTGIKFTDDVQVLVK